MAGMSDYFCGLPGQRESTGEFDFVHTPIYQSITHEDGTVDKFIVGYNREFVTVTTVEQVFRFEGLPANLAFSRDTVTVTDVNGASYTFALEPSITDGSNGTRVMPVETVDVQRNRMTPHMWELVVTRRGMRYFCNGSRLVMAAEPAWLTAILG